MPREEFDDLTIGDFHDHCCIEIEKKNLEVGEDLSLTNRSLSDVAEDVGDVREPGFMSETMNSEGLDAKTLMLTNLDKRRFSSIFTLILIF